VSAFTLLSLFLSSSKLHLFFGTLFLSPIDAAILLGYIKTANLAANERKNIISVFRPPRAVMSSSAILQGEGFAELWAKQLSEPSDCLAVFCAGLRVIGKAHVITLLNKTYFDGKQPTLPPLPAELVLNCLLVQFVSHLCEADLRLMLSAVAPGAPADSWVAADNRWQAIYFLLDKMKSAKAETLKNIETALLTPASFDSELREILDKLQEHR